MHQIDIDVNLKEIAKIEGAASLTIKIRQGKIIDLRFSIAEWKRFYTQAVIGKPILAVPQLLSRICGTCSNAHLLCAIEAIEKALGIAPSEQTILLRKLLMAGLVIRDHALHLYVFSLPDYFQKDSILDFDENNKEQHQFLHDLFEVKEVGNQLSIIVGGRSVHAPYPTIGGFTHLPKIEELKSLLPKLEAIRPKILTLMKVFEKSNWEMRPKFPLTFSALVSEDFSFLEGKIKTSKGKIIEEKDLGIHLEGVIIPYSHARGFLMEGNLFMVGALSRINLAKEYLHQRTKETIRSFFNRFPSNNLFDNNLAQAIEIIQAVDLAKKMIEKLDEIKPEAPKRPISQRAVGIGVIEAPRGTLYHQLSINEQGLIEQAEIIVPTGQNQIVMEKGISQIVEELLVKGEGKEKIVYEVEKFIRAFDPCMSCAAHFLKVKWQ